MRKHLKSLLLLLIIIVLASCSHEPEEVKYDVWTDYCTASEFSTSFGYTLNEGCYSHFPLTDSLFSQVTAGYKPDHNWTEAEIKNWLIGQGFDNSTATSEVAWITSNNHCMIATRNMGIVYFLMK